MKDALDNKSRQAESISIRRIPLSGTKFLVTDEVVLYTGTTMIDSAVITSNTGPEDEVILSCTGD